MMKIAIGICVLLLLMLIPHGYTQEPSNEPSTAPALYFYSGFYGGFIVERADGTDSHLMGMNVEYSYHNSRWGPGFSPSGRWFAWMSGQYRGYGGHFTAYPWIMETETNQRIAMLDGLAEVRYMAWSPTHDYLLVRYARGFRLPEPGEEYPDGVDPVYVFDMATQTIIAQVEASEYYPVQWTPDGEHLLVFEQDEDRERRLQTCWLKIIALDGSEPIERAQPGGCPQSPKHFENYLSHVTPEGTLVLEDLLTDESWEYPRFGVNALNIEWSPDGEQALIFTSRGQKWLWSAGDLRLLDDGQGFSTNFMVEDQEVWSRDSSFAVFADSDGVLKILDPRTFDLTQVPLPPNAETVTVRWSPQSEALYVAYHDQSYRETPLVRYDLETQALTTLGNFTSYFAISPDGQFLAVRCSNDNTDYLYFTCILDSETGETVSVISPNSQSFYQDLTYAAGFVWHPTENWLLIQESSGSEGGGAYVMVANAEGTIQREIGHTYLGSGSVSWLPPDLELVGEPLRIPLVEPTEIYRGAGQRAIAFYYGSLFVASGDQFMHFDLEGNLLEQSEPPEDDEGGRAHWYDSYRHQLLRFTSYGENGGNDLTSIVYDYQANHLYLYTWKQGITLNAVGLQNTSLFRWSDELFFLMQDERGAKLLNLSKNELVLRVDGTTSVALHLDHNQDQAWDGAGFADGSIQSWTVFPYNGNVTVEGSWQAHPNPVTHIAVNSDGWRMATSDGSEVQLWDTVTQQSLFQLEGYNPSFSPDGRWLAITIDKDDTQFITLWDVNRREKIAEFPGLQIIEWSQNGQVAIVSKQGEYSMEYLVMRVGSSVPIAGISSYYPAWSFSPNGNCLAVHSGIIKVINLNWSTVVAHYNRRASDIVWDHTGLYAIGPYDAYRWDVEITECTEN
ncbi:MAG: WD40 repeat domain-containing protein [Anaerolineae bacterium]|nr:WD40 repeat domain-containing protein [Anaerolineae bacterium]